MEMVQSIPTRARSRACGLSMHTHLTAVEPDVAILGADQIGARPLGTRMWLRVREVSQSSCRRQSRDKRQGLWGREWLSSYNDSV